MNYPALQGLKPSEFFKWFGEICKIPHGTGNEKALITFIENYAKQRNLYSVTDKKGNVYMQIPATKGYKDTPSILIQSHLDMVCKVDDGVNFDFEKDALNLIIKDGSLYADGTTLGADNGVGVATMLAIGNSTDIAHPMLEFLFTVEEESGLHGIREFDMSLIKSRRMINTDSGNSHMVAVSSLGCYKNAINKKFDLLPSNENTVAISVNLFGGLGGHAGLMSQAGRACAANLMGRLLSANIDGNVKLSSLETIDSAIITKLNAVIVVHKDLAEQKIQDIKNSFSKIALEYKLADPDLNVSLEIIDGNFSTISNEETQKIATLLTEIHTSPNKVVNGNLISLTIVKKGSLKDGNFSLEFSVNSSIDEEMASLFKNYHYIASQLGFTIEKVDQYPGWKESDSSPFRDLVIASHIKTFGYEPKIQRVLGGIEVSVIVEKIKDMDAVAITPTKKDVHTTNEHLILSETEDFWNWLIEILQSK